MQITYNDKLDGKVLPQDDAEKVTASNMNEIKIKHNMVVAVLDSLSEVLGLQLDSVTTLPASGTPDEAFIFVDNGVKKLYQFNSSGVPVPFEGGGGGGVTNPLKIGDYTLKTVNVADPGEPPVTTFVIQRDNETAFDEFTILEVKAPEAQPTEATIALMRTIDPQSGGPEFVDIFNQGYNDSHAFGFRIQARGSGSLLPFRMEFNKGTGVYTVHIMEPDGSFKHWINAGTFDATTGWFTPTVGSRTLAYELRSNGLLYNKNQPVLTRSQIIQDNKLFGAYATKQEALLDGLGVGDLYYKPDGQLALITDLDPNNEPSVGGGSTPNPFYYSAVYVSLADEPTNNMWITYHQDSVMEERFKLLESSLTNPAELRYIPIRNIFYREVGDTNWIDAGFTRWVNFRDHNQTIVHTKLEGLDADTLYEFVVGNPQEYIDNGFDVPIHSFLTLPASTTTPFNFAVGSDPHNESISGISPDTVNILDFAKTQNPRFWVVIGDWCNDEGQTRYAQRWTQFWEAHSTKFKDSYGNLVPIVPAIGNHDIAWKWGDQDVGGNGIKAITNGNTMDVQFTDRPYFLDVFPNLNQGEGEYGSIKIGNYMMLFIFSNNRISYATWTGTDFNTTQLDWADGVIQANPTIPFKLPFYHVSVFNTYAYRQFTEPNSLDRTKMVNLFNEHRMKLGFGGHDHNYKVTKEMVFDELASEDVGTDGRYAKFRTVDTGEYGFIEVGDGGMGNKIYPNTLGSNWYMELSFNNFMHCNIVTVKNNNELELNSYRIPFGQDFTNAQLIYTKNIDYTTGVRPENNESTLPPIHLFPPNNYTSNETGFIMTVFVGNGESVTIPTTGIGYDYNIDWGDSLTELNKTGDATHIYSTEGYYNIRITGSFPRIFVNNVGNIRTQLKAIRSWGNIAWSSMEFAFYGCTDVIVDAPNLPNLSGVSSMRGMFYNCASLVDPTNNINSWNVGTVDTFRDLFRGCTMFNNDVSNWNTSSATDFRSVFRDASSFNHGLTWQLTSCATAVAMLDNSGINPNNYDTFLIDLEDQANIFGLNAFVFGAAGLNYTANGASSRNFLITIVGLTITDGGQI